MAMIDSFQQSVPAFSRVTGVLLAVAQAFNAWQVRRGRRIALRQLLEFEPYLLDDIGVTIQDIEDARMLGAPVRPSKRRAW
ncbi:MAG: DUF1127 domain-containing protein [Devosia sp.]